MLIETETLYRLASAMFFTLEEDLTHYDIDINEDKIDKFKKHKSISDFFLSKPVKTYIPLPAISNEDLANLLKMTEARKKMKDYLLK